VTINLLDKSQFDEAGMHCHWDSRGFWLYRFDNVSRYTVDAWMKLSMQLDNIYANEGIHLRNFYYLQHVYPTPYLISRVAYVGSSLPNHLFESNAYIIVDSMLISMFETILRRQQSKVQKTIQFFRKDDDALKWLEARHQFFLETHPSN